MCVLICYACVFVSNDIYFKELAHMIMEAEKFQDLVRKLQKSSYKSASSRGADNAVQFRSTGLRTLGELMV